jgi:hypothetical protein
MLQINLVIEDAKISLDELQEDIAEIEDYVQSTDVAGTFIHNLTSYSCLYPSYAKALNGQFDLSCMELEENECICYNEEYPTSHMV